MDKFFDSNNPVMRFLSRLVDLVILNVVTLVYSLPLITAGGAFTAMNYVLLHLHRGDETYIIRMFRKSFRENFRQGIPEGLLVLAAAIKAQLISLIDSVTEASENLLERLHEDDIMDITTDIQRLQTTLASKGLLDSDFDI